jgi:hypothetical protein
MQVFIVTVQGRFVDVFSNMEDAEALKRSLHMGGNDGIAILPKTI